ncbi:MULTISPECIES: hypothetical protein [unclassified Sedimentibacter]|uniref:hypothetical protein n=1 Tax=unclassified Sedimentibacter TaxID=2649220 RepID=UPI0027DF02BE|nr:hypothetical protein [Sedimentibacter sp. MB35-C1]WMJ77674.1 hypothetical protein RBQ61_01745 [Sedimentibacter sp. MB35-C1]
MFKKKKLLFILVIIIISLCILFQRYQYSIIVMTSGGAIRTEEKIMYGEEVIEKKEQIRYLMEIFNDNQKLRDIRREYSRITDTMIPVEGKVAFDYAIVKQQYIVDKKLGWIPIGLPEIKIFEKND